CALEAPNKGNSVKAIVLAFLVSLFALSTVPTTPARAQDAAACEAKAVSKDGKPLAGAAKASSVKRCMRDYCEAHAVSSNGKKLSGAARTSFLKKCESTK